MASGFLKMVELWALSCSIHLIAVFAKPKLKAAVSHRKTLSALQYTPSTPNTNVNIDHIPAQAAHVLTKQGTQRASIPYHFKPMTIIALAGGTGSLGRTFLSALLASPTEHEIHILTRSNQTPTRTLNPTTTTSASSTTYHQADYTSIPSLTHILTTHNITTIISALTIESPSTSLAQQNLITAASACPTVTHFLPSEYGFPSTPAILAVAPIWQHWADNATCLERHQQLRHTRIQTGWFMDYFGMPHVRTNLSPFPWAVDVANRVAAVPGTGHERVSMTYTGDLARFVVWLVEHPEAGEWEREMTFLVGDDVTFKELVGWVEEMRGTGFREVVYDGEEKLGRGEVTTFEGQVEPVHKHWYAMFGLMAARGLMGLPREGRVDTEALGWRMESVRGLVSKAWDAR